MYEITFIRNFKNVVGQSTLKAVYRLIKDGKYAKEIISMRQMLAEGNTVGYNIAKKALLAFTAVATFDGGRKEQYRTGYSQVIVLDVDNLSPEELARVKALVIACPHTLCCFTSPSGNGLKIFIAVNSGVEEHLNAFLSAANYIYELTGVVVDPSGKDITRLCFVSDDPKAYYNDNATLYDWREHPTNAGVPPVGDKGSLEENVGAPRVGAHGNNVGAHPPPARRPARRIPASPKGIGDIMKVYRKCIAFVEQITHFVEGQRNAFVFQLALQLRLMGIPETTALFLIQQDYNYEASEVRGSVHSAYLHDLTRDMTPLCADKSRPVAKEPGDQKPPGSDKSRPVQNKKGGSRKSRKRDAAYLGFPTLEELDRLLNANALYQNYMTSLENEQPKPKSRMPYCHKTIEVMIMCLFELRYNLVKKVVDWRMRGSKEAYQKLDDHAENSIFRWLHNHGQYIMMSSLHNVIFSNLCEYIHPFKDYFKHLRWDGHTDYIGQLCRTVKTTDDEYFEICIRKWFVAYAAALFNDEVINHTVIVLVGPQGLGKTRWLRKLVPPALQSYLGPGTIQTDSKDTQIMMAECCLIILDELESLNRHDLAEIKRLITLDAFNIRKPYGRSSDIMTRHASFVASVNYDQVLTDPSGSRRYLCFTVTDIDYQHDVNINGCMAQAKALYHRGFRYWFDQKEIDELTNRNEDYMSRTIEEDLILTWFRTATREEWDNKDKHISDNNLCLMSAADIAIFLSTKARIVLQNSTTTMVSKILRKLKYVRIRKHGEGYLYIVRLLKEDDVTRNRRTLEEDDKTNLNDDHNNDLSGPQEPDPELPF